MLRCLCVVVPLRHCAFVAFLSATKTPGHKVQRSHLKPYLNHCSVTGQADIEINPVKASGFTGRVIKVYRFPEL